MKKLILFLLIISVICLTSIFLFPKITLELAKKAGAEGLYKTIITLKAKLDKISVQDIQDAYSGALEVKDKMVNGIKETKDTIEDIRVKAEQAQKTYNQAKDFVDNTQKKLDDAKKILNDVEKLGNSIKGFVNTGAIQ